MIEPLQLATNAASFIMLALFLHILPPASCFEGVAVKFTCLLTAFANVLLVWEHFR